MRHQATLLNMSTQLTEYETNLVEIRTSHETEMEACIRREAAATQAAAEARAEVARLEAALARTQARAWGLASNSGAFADTQLARRTLRHTLHAWSAAARVRAARRAALLRWLTHVRVGHERRCWARWRLHVASLRADARIASMRRAIAGDAASAVVQARGTATRAVARHHAAVALSNWALDATRQRSRASCLRVVVAAWRSRHLRRSLNQWRWATHAARAAEAVQAAGEAHRAALERERQEGLRRVDEARAGGEEAVKVAREDAAARGRTMAREAAEAAIARARAVVVLDRWVQRVRMRHLEPAFLHWQYVPPCCLRVPVCGHLCLLVCVCACLCLCVCVSVSVSVSRYIARQWAEERAQEAAAHAQFTAAAARSHRISILAASAVQRWRQRTKLRCWNAWRVFVHHAAAQRARTHAIHHAVVHMLERRREHTLASLFYTWRLRAALGVRERMAGARRALVGGEHLARLGRRLFVRRAFRTWCAASFSAHAREATEAQLRRWVVARRRRRALATWRAMAAARRTQRRAVAMLAARASGWRSRMLSLALHTWSRAVAEVAAEADRAQQGRRDAMLGRVVASWASSRRVGAAFAVWRVHARVARRRRRAQDSGARRLVRVTQSALRRWRAVRVRAAWSRWRHATDVAAAMAARGWAVFPAVQALAGLRARETKRLVLHVWCTAAKISGKHLEWAYKVRRELRAAGGWCVHVRVGHLTAVCC